MKLDTAKQLIINHNKKIEEEKKLKKKIIKKEEKILEEKIRSLEPKIRNIIILGNFCLKNNVKVWRKGLEDVIYKNKCFETDGIKHQLGFYRNHFEGYPVYRCKKYEYIGFENGGFCGNWDFVTNGVEIFEILEEKDKITTIGPHSTVRKPTIRQMTRFLKEFDNFEKEFYNYIQNL